MASRRISSRIIADPVAGPPTEETPPEFRVHALTLAPEAAGLRFDQALAQALPQYSRARLKAWIDSGAVEVDGRPLRGKDKVLGGEQVRIHAQLPAQDRVQAEVIPLAVIFRDRSLLVIDKPAGLVVHPGAGNARHTLQNALLALDPGLALLPRAGLVHRLDKDTSGLLLVARTPEAHSALIKVMAARQITLDVSFDFIAVSSYGNAKHQSGEVRLTKDVDRSMEGSNIVLVEDILDTGLTLTYIISMLRGRRPKALKIAALLDKASRRTQPIHGDYVGFEIPDEFVVGYGLDFAEHYRNLPDICVLESGPESE